MNAPAAAALAAPQLSLSLIGVPNCGKTALFNRLTGSRQKVANYPGVTVERKEGRLVGPRTGRTFRVIDLPGAYSLEPATLDEAIARDVVLGRHETGYRVPARLAVLSRLDAVVLNPIAGPALLAIVLFCMFQAVFSWAKAPQNLINTGVQGVNAWLSGVLPPGPLRGLLLDGVVA